MATHQPARGGLVDELDLVQALQSGHIAVAGLDVFWAEKDPAHHHAAMDLVQLPNVVATPIPPPPPRKA